MGTRQMSVSDSLQERPIVTFYSYKGGVGRSMALANTAIILARDYGMQAIVVDWDLEAPGLHRFFDIPDSDVRDGLVDYIERYKTWVLKLSGTRADPPRLADALITVRRFGSGGAVRLLASGKLVPDDEYAKRINGFDWDEFYREWNGAQFVEFLRSSFKKEAHITFVDSRTGITDIGGICTLQIPDKVVLVFAFNEQNLLGSARVARDVSGPNAIFESIGRRPELLLLPSRKELSEIERLRKWEHRAAEVLGPFLSHDLMDRFGGTLEYIRLTAVQYVPYFAFGEQLAVETEKGVELARPLKLLAQTLAGEAPKLPEPKAHSTSWRFDLPIAQIPSMIFLVIGLSSIFPENVRLGVAVPCYLAGALFTYYAFRYPYRRRNLTSLGLICLVVGSLVLFWIHLNYVVQVHLGPSETSFDYLIGYRLSSVGRVFAETTNMSMARLVQMAGVDEIGKLWGSSYRVLSIVYAVSASLVFAGLMAVLYGLQVGTKIVSMYRRYIRRLIP